MAEQTGLPGFDFEDSPRATLMDGPIARPARVGFLAGMFAVWFCGGRPSTTQKERLKDIARDALERAAAVNPGGLR